MSRILCLLGLFFLMVACSSDPTPVNTDDPNSQNPTETEDPESDPVEPDGFYITGSSSLGTPNTEDARSVVVTDAGNIIFTVQEELDVTVYSVNQSFKIQWERTFTNLFIDDIINTNDGNLIAIGVNKLTPSVDQEDYILKFDPMGNTIWDKAFPSIGQSFDDILEAANGDLLITGTVNSQSNFIVSDKGDGDLMVLRLNSAGDVLSTWNYGGTSFDTGRVIIRDNNGNFVVLGSAESSDLDVSENNDNSNAWVVRIDPDGVLLDEKSFGTSMGNFSVSLVELNNGHFVVVSENDIADGDASGSLGLQDAWLVVFNQSLELLSERSIGGSSQDLGRKILALPNGQILFLGLTSSTDVDVSSNNGSVDYWLVRLSTDLEILEEITFGGSGYDASWDMDYVDDETVVIIGNSGSSDGDVSSNEGGFDPWLFLVDLNL